MPLYKEQKRKRMQDEDEILRNYHASMNKPKRKYKQRKSKYDPELWDSLTLHKPPKKMESQGNQFIEDRNGDSYTIYGITPTGNLSEAKSSLRCNAINNDFDKIVSLQSEIGVPFGSQNTRCQVKGYDNLQTIGLVNEEKRISHNSNIGCSLKSVHIEKGYDNLQTTGVANEETGIGHHSNLGCSQKNVHREKVYDNLQTIGLVNEETGIGHNSNLGCSQKNVHREDYCNTLLVRRILGFLLDENSVVDKRNMVHTLLLDSTLKNACLVEIEKRCRVLNTLHEKILPKLKKEQTLLLDIVKYINPSKSTITSFTDTNGREFGEKDVDCVTAVEGNLKDQTEQEAVSSLSFDDSFYTDTDNIDPKYTEDKDQPLENNIEMSYQSTRDAAKPFDDIALMDDLLLLSPSHIAHIDTNLNHLYEQDYSINTMPNHFPGSKSIYRTGDSNTDEMLRLAEIISNSS